MDKQNKFNKGDKVRIKDNFCCFVPDTFTNKDLYIYKSEPLNNGEIVVATENGKFITTIPKNKLYLVDQENIERIINNLPLSGSRNLTDKELEAIQEYSKVANFIDQREIDYFNGFIAGICFLGADESDDLYKTPFIDFLKEVYYKYKYKK